MNIGKTKTMLFTLCSVCLLSVFCVCSTSASAGSVTGYQKITWGISTGRYYVNGIHAFCAQYNKSWPLVGTNVERIELCNNEVLRKVLYYGYNGPKNTLGTDEKAHVLTAIAVSDANIGERQTGASAKYDEFYWDIVNNPSKYPTPPTNFKAYMAITAGDELQNLAFYEFEKNGYVTGIKISENPELTDGNECYSLAGAQYGIYKSQTISESAKVGTLTMDANGKSNTVELSPGIYYAYELVAPKGYEKSDKITQFTVTKEKTTTLSFSDKPKLIPIDILLQKVDADTNTSRPQGAGTLKGAQFTVKFFPGLWEQNTNPESLGVSPSRTWVFETDEQGVIKYTEKYRVPGHASDDAKDNTLYNSLPLGTLVIQETKASEGYMLNEKIFVRQLTAGESQISAFQSPVIPEQVITYDLVLHKSDSNDKVLEGAEFTLYSDKECEQELQKGLTDENGELRFENLFPKVNYYLKETKTPTGYLGPTNADGEQLVYEIYEEGMPSEEVHMNVKNEKDFVLPNTGTSIPLIMNLTGGTLCAISIYLMRKKKEEKGEL